MTETEPTNKAEEAGDTAPRRSRLKVLFANLALIGASTTIALLVAEAAIRVVAPQQLILIRPDVWQEADTVGWLHRANVTTEINTGERTVSLYTDVDGFRVGAAGPVQADRQILLLGDSFMEALQVDYEDSGPGLIESRLGEAVGEPVGVRNGGIGGWDPDQYLLRARALMPAAHYDAVVVAVYLGNDVVGRAREYISPRQAVRRYRLRLPRSLSGQEVVDALLRPLNDFLEVRSHFYVFVKNRLQQFRMRLGLAVLTFPPAFLSETAEGNQWDVTVGLLEGIHSLARNHETPVLFVLIPAPFQIDPDDLARYVEGYGIDPAGIDLEQPNRIIMSELEERGMDVIDLLPAFRRAHGEGVRLYGAVDQHFTPEGNLLFADLVTPELVTLLAGEDDDVSAGQSSSR